MDLEGLVRSHGYAAVPCSTLLEGETIVVIAALAIGGIALWRLRARRRDADGAGTPLS